MEDSPPIGSWMVVDGILGGDEGRPPMGGSFDSTHRVPHSPSLYSMGDSEGVPPTNPPSPSSSSSFSEFDKCLNELEAAWAKASRTKGIVPIPLWERVKIRSREGFLSQNETSPRGGSSSNSLGGSGPLVSEFFFDKNAKVEAKQQPVSTYKSSSKSNSSKLDEGGGVSIARSHNSNIPADPLNGIADEQLNTKINIKHSPEFAELFGGDSSADENAVDSPAAVPPAGSLDFECRRISNKNKPVFPGLSNPESSGSPNSSINAKDSLASPHPFSPNLATRHGRTQTKDNGGSGCSVNSNDYSKNKNEEGGNDRPAAAAAGAATAPEQLEPPKKSVVSVKKGRNPRHLHLKSGGAPIKLTLLCTSSNLDSRRKRRENWRRSTSVNSCNSSSSSNSHLASTRTAGTTMANHGEVGAGAAGSTLVSNTTTSSSAKGPTSRSRNSILRRILPSFNSPKKVQRAAGGGRTGEDGQGTTSTTKSKSSTSTGRKSVFFFRRGASKKDIAAAAAAEAHSVGAGNNGSSSSSSSKDTPSGASQSGQRDVEIDNGEASKEKKNNKRSRKSVSGYASVLRKVIGLHERQIRRLQKERRREQSRRRTELMKWQRWALPDLYRRALDAKSFAGRIKLKGKVSSSEIEKLLGQHQTVMRRRSFQQRAASTLARVHTIYEAIRRQCSRPFRSREQHRRQRLRALVSFGYSSANALKNFGGRSADDQPDSPTSSSSSASSSSSMYYHAMDPTDQTEYEALMLDQRSLEGKFISRMATVYSPLSSSHPAERTPEPPGFVDTGLPGSLALRTTQDAAAANADNADGGEIHSKYMTVAGDGGGMDHQQHMGLFSSPREADDSKENASGRSSTTSDSGFRGTSNTSTKTTSSAVGKDHSHEYKKIRSYIVMQGLRIAYGSEEYPNCAVSCLALYADRMLVPLLRPLLKLAKKQDEIDADMRFCKFVRWARNMTTPAQFGILAKFCPEGYHNRSQSGERTGARRRRRKYGCGGSEDNGNNIFVSSSSSNNKNKNGKKNSRLLFEIYPKSVRVLSSIQSSRSPTDALRCLLETVTTVREEAERKGVVGQVIKVKLGHRQQGCTRPQTAVQGPAPHPYDMLVLGKYALDKRKADVLPTLLSPTPEESNDTTTPEIACNQYTAHGHGEEYNDGDAKGDQRRETVDIDADMLFPIVVWVFVHADIPSATTYGETGMALALAQAASSHIASLKPKDFTRENDTKEGILHMHRDSGPSSIVSDAIEVFRGGDDQSANGQVVEEEGIEIKFENKGEASGEGDVPSDNGEGSPMGGEDRSIATATTTTTDTATTLDCPVCGAKLRKSARICNECGTELATCRNAHNERDG
eukprot:jgi/Bigna1/73199/fgenesh1_pg.23_\